MKSPYKKPLKKNIQNPRKACICLYMHIETQLVVNLQEQFVIKLTENIKEEKLNPYNKYVFLCIRFHV